MSEASPEHSKDKGIAETVPCRPDLLLAEYLELMDAEARAGIDGGRMDDAAVERRRGLKEDLCRAIDEDRRRALKEEHRRAIDRQIMVGNHRDLANVYARMMLLGSC